MSFRLLRLWPVDDREVSRINVVPTDINRPIKLHERSAVHVDRFHFSGQIRKPLEFRCVGYHNPLVRQFFLQPLSFFNGRHGLTFLRCCDRRNSPSWRCAFCANRLTLSSRGVLPISDSRWLDNDGDQNGQFCSAREKSGVARRSRMKTAGSTDKTPA